MDTKSVGFFVLIVPHALIGAYNPTLFPIGDDNLMMLCPIWGCRFIESGGTNFSRQLGQQTAALAKSLNGTWYSTQVGVFGNL